MQNLEGVLKVLKAGRKCMKMRGRLLFQEPIQLREAPFRRMACVFLVSRVPQDLVVHLGQGDTHRGEMCMLCSSSRFSIHAELACTHVNQNVEV